MNILTSMRERLDRLTSCEELSVEASALPASALRLSDQSVIELLAEAAAIANDANRLKAVLAGVAARRSRREDGHSGLAATQGHATPAALVQAITGGTKADASRQVRVGTALLEDVSPEAAAEEPAAASDGKPEALPWHDPLRRALLDRMITSEQHDAIRVGLGEPPRDDGVTPEFAREAWALAAEQLIVEAATAPTEELAKRARTVRDLLDPEGAQARFDRRFDERSYRMWVDADGRNHGRISFDDEMALWVRSMLDAGLRPRRGGPRFVSDEERATAEALAEDPRTNEQLEYDLLMDVLRAGSLANASEVFGARQPGVRMVVVKDAVGPRDALGRLLATGHAEDGGESLPGSVIERTVCSVGSVDVTVDSCGNPLDVGREQRLYSSRQRIALAVRDGGCLWPGCSRPASYCEAHHCDHYVEGGCTDIDRGVLLCRFHHMLLHNRGWRIGREAKGRFVLHPPPGEGSPIVLASKAPWKWAWDPPPPPERAGWRAARARAGTPLLSA